MMIVVGVYTLQSIRISWQQFHDSATMFHILFTFCLVLPQCLIAVISHKLVMFAYVQTIFLYRYSDKPLHAKSPEEDLKFIKLTETHYYGIKLRSILFASSWIAKFSEMYLKTNSSLAENTMHSHYKEKLSLSIPKNLVKCKQNSYKVLAQ